MIHKTSSFGHWGWARKAALDQQPGIGRLAVENHVQVGSSRGGGAARFDGGGRVSPVVDGVGGFRWGNVGSSHLKNSTMNQDEVKKLDLSLRL